MARSYIPSHSQQKPPSEGDQTLPKQFREVRKSRGEAKLPLPLLKVEDLATLLATSSSGIYSRVARGQIPGALRFGRSIRFNPHVIAEWIAAKSTSQGLIP